MVAASSTVEALPVLLRGPAPLARALVPLVARDAPLVTGAVGASSVLVHRSGWRGAGPHTGGAAGPAVPSTRSLAGRCR
jgi:hypothetical protein